MKPKAALIASTPVIFNVFYKNHIRFLQDKYDLTLISNFEADKCTIENLPMIHVAMNRDPSLLSDLNSLLKLITIFKKEKFDIVHTTTPKAGLLGQLAAYIIGVDVRLHFFTGQVWANKIGFKRELLKFIDRVIGYLPTHLLADSYSQKQFLEDEKIIPKNKITVLGRGSISGVNLNKFNSKNRLALRTTEGILPNQFVFLFLGRLNKDKGVLDLISAFELIIKVNPNAILFIVGRDEEELLPVIKKHKLYNKSMFYREFTTQPEDYMSIADVFCLPSYREGFGSVIIEASACGTPSIGSNIYGLTDAIEDGRTGLLCAVASPNDLANKMADLLANKQKLKSFSENGLLRVQQDFDENILSGLLISYYENFKSNNRSN